MIIFCFGGVSGVYLNLIITIGILFVWLRLLPRVAFYVCFQMAGGVFGGLLA